MVRQAPIRRRLFPAILGLVGRRLLRGLHRRVFVVEEEELYEKMNMNKSELFTTLEEFQNLPGGFLIDRPDELLWFYQDFFFTRKSLKHLAEKDKEGRRLLDIIPEIIGGPTRIFKGKGNRKIFVRLFSNIKNGEPHMVVLEPRDGIIIIVTSFVTDEKYLKNFEILWRTGG